MCGCECILSLPPSSRPMARIGVAAGVWFRCKSELARERVNTPPPPPASPPALSRRPNARRPVRVSGVFRVGRGGTVVRFGIFEGKSSSSVDVLVFG